MAGIPSPRKIKWAFFTAPSGAGKTTLQTVLQARCKAELLDNDSNILSPAFDLLAPGQNLHQSISPLSAWQHIREQYDFVNLYQLLHRDWFYHTCCPQRIIAVGWLYGIEEWRQKALASFASLEQIEIEQKLFVLKLPLEELFKRLSNMFDERHNGKWPGKKKLSKSEKIEIVAEHHRQFFANHLSSNRDTIVCRSDEELIESMDIFFES